MEQEKQRTREFWDANPCGLSSSWAQTKHVRYYYTDAYLLEYLIEDTFAEKSVLEVGCGQGVDASEILKYCASYHGVDLSERSLKIARREVSKAQSNKVAAVFTNQDAEQLAFHDNSFDVVYSIGVLHHTANFEKAVSEIYRVLSKNGILILMLYRSYTPLWAIVKAARALLKIPLVGPKVRNSLMDSIRDNREKQTESLVGTAILELIGSPIINTYSIGDLQKHFADRYQILATQSYRVGIDQVIRVLPKSLRDKLPQKSITRFEKSFRERLGFYLVVRAKRL